MTQGQSTQTIRDTTDPDAIASSEVPATYQTDRHPLAEAGEQASQTAGHLAERAAGLGLEQADHGRHLAADGIETVARSFRRLSTEIADDQPAIASAAFTWGGWPLVAAIGAAMPALALLLFVVEQRSFR